MSRIKTLAVSFGDSIEAILLENETVASGNAISEARTPNTNTERSRDVSKFANAKSNHQLQDVSNSMSSLYSDLKQEMSKEKSKHNQLRPADSTTRKTGFGAAASASREVALKWLEMGNEKSFSKKGLDLIDFSNSSARQTYEAPRYSRASEAVVKNTSPWKASSIGPDHICTHPHSHDNNNNNNNSGDLSSSEKSVPLGIIVIQRR
jgi:hypothetical protein